MLICTCLSSSISIFLNEIKFFIITSQGLKGLVIANVILIGTLVLINFSYPIFKKKIKTTDYNFSGVVRNMELEIICGFSLFYILMVVIDGYDIYSIIDQLFTIVDSSIRHYVLALIVFIVSLLISIIVVGNLFVITKKFDEINLVSSISLYL